jgi:hypothetical protein
VELALSIAGGLDRGAAGRQPHLERCSVPGGPGLGKLVAAQGLAGRPGGIQWVGLGAMASGGPLGPVQLDHPLGVGMKEPGQPGAVAAGALDRPDPLAWLSVGQRQQLLVAGRGGCRRGLIQHRAGGGGQDGDGVGVGVEPDDDLHEVCQHAHRVDSLARRPT